MGLRPAAIEEYRNVLSRVPRLLPKSTSRTTGTTGPSDDSPAPGRPAAPHSGSTPIEGGYVLKSTPSRLESDESVGSQALLVQLLPKQFRQGLLVQGRIVQQGEKPVINLKITPSQKRVELISTPKLESEGKLKKPTTEGKSKPRPGDLIEIFRIGYEHWAIYVEDDCVVHLAPRVRVDLLLEYQYGGEAFEVGSITSIFSNRAVVKCSRLEDVLHGCSWKVNNKLDGTYLPLPVDKIIQRTKNMINKIVQYSLIEGNCEHFVNDLRYGVSRSQQVEHVLVKGAKAAGAVISAVVDSVRPNPLTA